MALSAKDIPSRIWISRKRSEPLTSDICHFDMVLRRDFYLSQIYPFLVLPELFFIVYNIFLHGEFRVNNSSCPKPIWKLVCPAFNCSEKLLRCSPHWYQRQDFHEWAHIRFPSPVSGLNIDMELEHKWAFFTLLILVTLDFFDWFSWLD